MLLNLLEISVHEELEYFDRRFDVLLAHDGVRAVGVAGDDREANRFDAAADERHGACVRAADIDDVFLVRNVVFFAQRDGFIHKAFVADGTGVGDFDGDAVVKRVAALQIARAVVARGDVHRDADVRLNTLRRDLPAAR